MAAGDQREHGDEVTRKWITIYLLRLFGGCDVPGFVVDPTRARVALAQLLVGVFGRETGVREQGGGSPKRFGENRKDHPANFGNHG